jgi:hypothetical protein
MSNKARIKSYATGAGIRAASRAGAYLRAGPGGVNVEKIVFYGALLLGGYVVYRTVTAVSRTASTIKAGTDAVGSAIGRGLYDLFHPNANERATSTMFGVWFPPSGGFPGAFHAVDSLDVDSSGMFKREGIKYQMLILKTPQKAPDGRAIHKVAIRQ